MKKTTFLFTFLILLAYYGHAQPVSGYLFSQSTETYTAVSGTNSLATGDDGSENNLDIGFPFFFGGVEYTTFSISTNGFIRLGNAIGGNNWINGFDNALAQAPLIAAFWDDNNRNGGSIQYAVSGLAPNRTLEVGWNQVNIGNNGQTNNTVSASYKIRLHETTNVIEMIYGPQMTWSGGITASIGLNDLVSFLSVTPAAGSATVSSAVSDNLILSTDNIINNKYVFTPPPNCSGTPAPGNTIALVASVCPGFSFDLSVENISAESGVSYQWQSSPDGVTYSDITDADTAEITVTQSVETYYQCVVTCAFGSAAVTIPVVITMNAPLTCFCNPTYTFGKTDGDLISNVAIAGTTLSNNTGTVPENPSYTYFTGQPNYTASLESGTSYEIQITAGSYGNQNSAVWIDFNDDTIFSAEERVGYTTESVDSFGTAIYTIALACDAPVGLHRMRIRDVWNTDGDTIDPCDNYGYGETEDYDITILPQTVCPTATDLGTGTITAYTAELVWAGGCGQVSWDAHVALAGGGLPTGAASHPNVTSPVEIAGLSPDTTYEFYILSHCDAIGDSIWSGPFTFTTNAEPPANDECSGSVGLQVGANFDEFSIVTTNAGATKSLSAADPTCAAFNFGGDVWYSIVVPSTGNLTVETRNETGSPIADTGLSILTGTCGGTLTALGCSDDEGNGAFSKLSVTGLTPGETVYARVWEYANDAFGAFRISAWDATLGSNSFHMDGFAYYPNPVKDVLNLSYVQNITEVKVYNLMGQQVMSKSIGSDAGQIDMSSLSKGAYFVKVNAQNQTGTIRIIKE